MKKLYKLFIIYFFIIFFSCSKDDNHNNINNETIQISKVIGKYNFIFSTNNTPNKSIKSKLSVLDSNKKLIYKSNYNYNKSDFNYKLDQVENILKISNSLDDNFDYDYYQKLSEDFKKFMTFVFIEYKDKETVLESLSFHNSIIDVKKRSILEGKDCECTLHPGYLLGKNGFICQEDFILNVSELKSIINKTPSIFVDEGSEKLKNYLSKKTLKNTISFKELYSNYTDIDAYNSSLKALKNEKSQAGCILGSGSSHGCCGNYAGCCYYVNPICHIHDALCTDCKPKWFCLSGCKPDK